MLQPPTTLNCKGKLLDLTTPIVMGILNITPDSFYDGGRYDHSDTILRQVEKMLSEGAEILDIGGMSSRPGAKLIDVETERSRVLPVIELILKHFPETIISVDTVRSKVAADSVKMGARMVNDISAGSIDDSMFSTVAALDCPYILMHMQGTPQSMQEKPHYEDIILEITDFFIRKIGELRALGLKDLIIDPGFGFGKEIHHNFRLLKYLDAFQILDCLILAGLSRKSFIYKTLNTSAKNALNGTIATQIIALQQGAKILRVHDVKEAKETIKIWQAVENE